jgi:hypothetical protein
MRKSDPTNRKFLVGTVVVVAAFCFWPNWLTGLFVLAVVLGWIFHDSHSFTRAVWRTVLLIGMIGGIGWAGGWIMSPPAALTDQVWYQVGGAFIVIALSIFGFVRSIRKARKDWIMAGY